MKTEIIFRATKAVCLALIPGLATVHAGQASNPGPAPQAIPRSQLGAKAGADYQGEGLAVSPTARGARLRCVFQRLEGEATTEGLWLTSTLTNTMTERFRVVAVAVGRQPSIVRDEVTSLTSVAPIHSEPTCVGSYNAIATKGTVSIDGQTARFLRSGVVEEYSVSMDGVRQDFVVMQNAECRMQNDNPLPESVGNQSEGELVVSLAVTGAQVEPTTYGAQLVLEIRPQDRLQPPARDRRHRQGIARADGSAEKFQIPANSKFQI